MAAEAARATALLERLEQATLAKAFRGELVGNGVVDVIDQELATVIESGPVQLKIELE